jgi:ABC-type Na+ efflux pump permease subunit
METKNKVKQIVVNVSDDSKTKINSLKDKFNASDKEFIAAVLVVLETATDETIQAAVDKVTSEKQVAKVQARIAKLEAKVAQEKAALVNTTVDTSNEEYAAEEGHD